MSTKDIKELEGLAKNGDVGAIYELGKIYYNGTGIGVDFEKARGYFEVAAERGSEGANYFLGKIYYNGNGVETNHLKAKEYFEKLPIKSKKRKLYENYEFEKLDPEKIAKFFKAKRAITPYEFAKLDFEDKQNIYQDRYLDVTYPMSGVR